MIHLKEDRDNYVLVDREGGTFGGDIVYEGLEEVIEIFREWAEREEYEDASLKGMTINECLNNWNLDLQRYKNCEWVKAEKDILNTIIK